MDERERKENQDIKEEAKPKNAVHRLYDKLPVTYRQVDIFVKVMLALVAVLLVYGIIKGRA